MPTAVTAVFNADSKQFQSELAKMESKTGGFVRNVISKVGAASASILGLGAGYVGVSGFDQVLERVTQIKKEADQTGFDTDKIQKFDYALRQMGISADAGKNALGVLDKNIGDAEDGITAATKKFQEWGIVISGKTNAEIFQDIQDKIRNTEDPAKRVAMAMDLMGRGAREMLPYLTSSNEEIKTLGDHAPIFNEQELRNIETVHRTVTNIKDELLALAGRVINVIVKSVVGDTPKPGAPKPVDDRIPLEKKIDADSDRLQAAQNRVSSFGRISPRDPRMAAFREAQKEVEEAQAELDKAQAEYGDKYSGRQGADRLRRERAEVAAKAPKPVEPPLVGTDAPQQDTKKDAEELVEIYRLQVELQEKMFQNKLKGLTPVEREAALRKEIAKHEADAKFYASVGDVDNDKKSLEEQNKAESLKGELQVVQKQEGKKEHGMFPITEHQKIGAYAATPPDMVMHGLLKKVIDNTSHLVPQNNKPPGPIPTQHGPTYR